MDKEKLDYVFETYKPVQNKEEISWLLDKIESTIGKPKVALEIGVENGGTSGIWKEILDSEGILIGIDVGKLSGNQIYGVGTGDSKKLFFVQGDSRSEESFSRVKEILAENGKSEDGIDYIFIDGSHDYFVVKSDYEKYSKLIGGGVGGRRKGLVAFHDIWTHDQSTTLQNVDLNDGLNGSVTRFWLEVTEDFKKGSGVDRKYPEIKRLEFMQAKTGFNIGIGCLWVEW